MLEGTDVALRAVEPEDLEQLRLWRNMPHFRQFFRESFELSRQHQQAWYENISRKDSRHQMFAIVDRHSQQLLGVCGLCYIDWIHRSADFSIYIGYDGLYIDDIFAVDAAKLLIDYGFNVLNLHRLWTEIYSIDFSKQTFFPKIGFTLEARMKETYWHEGTWHDSLFYSLLEDVHKKRVSI